MKHNKIPKKGFEAWFYKKFPGSIKTKRAILISLILIIFAISACLFALTKYSLVDAQNSKDFSERIAKTKIQ